MTKAFTTRMCIYTEKSVRPTTTAKLYDRLLRNNIYRLRDVTCSERSHVASLITSAQHRARCGDNYNTHMLIRNAVEIMIGKKYYD